MTDQALVPPEQHEHDGGWLVIRAEGKASHVIPARDLRPHECSAECWCRPRIDEDDDLVVHNSLDKREFVERGEVPTQ